MKKIAISLAIAAAMASTPALAVGRGKGFCPGNSGWISNVQRLLGRLGGQAVGAYAQSCARD